MKTDPNDPKGPMVLDYAAPAAEAQEQQQAQQQASWYDGIDPLCWVDLSPLVDGASYVASGSVEVIGHVLGAIGDGIG